MPRFRLPWLAIADGSNRERPDATRVLIDRRLAQLVENPTVDPDADYNERCDQWSVPVGADALVFYAVVREPLTVIVRLVSFT